MSETTERERRVGEIFLGAVALDGERRAAYITSQCGGDGALLRAVESLFDSDGRADDFLETPVAAQFTAGVELQDPDFSAGVPLELARPGDVIGGYRILEPIGSGGMSQVFSAEAGDPEVGHPVAIKVLYPSPTTSRWRGSFATEARALTELDHPSIVKLLDGGVTEAGFHYLVMELVAGAPIDRYCAEHQLSLQEILGVFVAVCGAVSFAHQRLVVHRDLKPSNILVTKEGLPKLLDFGVAKFLDPLGRFDTITAGIGRAMTPNYASPEQLTGDRMTTASDVYSLGVILFELLTGRLPFDRRKPTPDGVNGCLEATPPPRPSRAAAVAGEGRGDSATLARSRALEGDLDAILTKALQPDPAQRYSSVEQLTDDVERYLRGLPVRALPPSIGYQMRRFVRRHRLFLSTVSAFAVLVVGTASVAVVQSFRLSRERDVAVAARQEAERQQELSQEVVDYLTGSFELADPSRHPGEVTALEVVESGAAWVEGLSTQPAVQATIRHTLGAIYLGLGQPQRAEPYLQQSLAFQRQQPGGDVDVAEVLHSLARSRLDQAAYGEALELSREALRLNRRALGYRHEAVAASLTYAARAHQGLGNLARAETLNRQALSLRLERLGPDHPEVAESLVSLVRVLDAAGDRDEARQLAERAISIRRASFGDDHPATEEAWTALLDVLVHSSELDAALEVAQRTVDVSTRAFGREHPRSLTNLSNFAEVLFYLGRFEEAEGIFWEVTAASERKLGPDHPDVGFRLSSLGMLISERGRAAEADPLLRRGLEIGRRSLGDGHFGITPLLNNLAINLTRQGRWEEAVSTQREAVEICRTRLGAGHLETLSRRSNLASMLRARGRRDEAEQIFREALGDARTGLPPDHLMTARILRGLTALLIDQERFQEARGLASEALEMVQRLTPEDRREIASLRQKLGMILAGLGELEQAEAELVRAYEDVGDEPSARSVRRAIVWCLAELYEGRDEERAARFRRELEEFTAARAAD